MPADGSYGAVKRKSKPNEDKKFQVYQHGRAWYVDYEGDTYSFMSETEANRFCARTKNMPGRVVRMHRY